MCEKKTYMLISIIRAWFLFTSKWLNAKCIFFLLQSHTDEQSDREDEIRDCDSSDEGVNVNPSSNPLTTQPMGFGRSPEHTSDMR